MESISGWSLLGWADFTYSLLLPGSPSCIPVFEDKKISGFIMVSITCLTPQGAPWPPTFWRLCLSLWAFFFVAAVAVSAAEPEEALWRWSHSSTQPTCWNFPEILHCRHFPRRYANGIRKNQLSLRNRGMRRAVNATG